MKNLQSIRLFILILIISGYNKTGTKLNGTKRTQILLTNQTTLE